MPGWHAKVAELVDALALGASGATRESSSLSFRTSPGIDKTMNPEVLDQAGVPRGGRPVGHRQVTGKQDAGYR